MSCLLCFTIFLGNFVEYSAVFFRLSTLEEVKNLLSCNRIFSLPHYVDRNSKIYSNRILVSIKVVIDNEQMQFITSPSCSPPSINRRQRVDIFDGLRLTTGGTNDLSLSYNSTVVLCILIYRQSVSSSSPLPAVVVSRTIL